MQRKLLKTIILKRKLNKGSNISHVKEALVFMS